MFCLNIFCLGQTVKVVNSDNEAIDGVELLIFSQGDSNLQVSNSNGIVNLTTGWTIDSIQFTHTTYSNITLSPKQLKKQRYRVKLQIDQHMMKPYYRRHNPDADKQKDQVHKVLTIKQKQIKFHNPQTTADLLALSNQIFIQKSQMGGGSPMIRGFSANNVLIVVDGVRMNNAIFRDGNIQNVISIDPHLIAQTEIVFGPGSVIYGSDAMGGVMAFETKTPKISDKQYYDGNVMLRTATANKENSWHVDLAYGNGKFAGLSSISLSNYGELKMGNNGPIEYTQPTFSEFNGHTDSIIQSDNPNIQYFTSYSQVNLNQKFRYQPDSLNDFILHYGFTTSSPIPRYDRLIQTQNNHPKYGDWYYGPQKWSQINGRYSRKLPKSKWANKMIATLAHQRFQESRFVRLFQSDNLEHNTEVVDVYSANIDFDKKIKKLDVLYGFEAVANRVLSVGIGNQIDSGFTYDIATRYPDKSTMNTTAFYLSAKRKIRAKWLISAGTRYSYIDLKAPFDNSFYDFPFTSITLQKSAVSGSLGLRYLMNTNSFIFANAASGFRAPNIDDMGKIFNSQPDRVIVPNDNLQPEYSYNGEIGIHLELAGNVEIMVNTFYTLIDNVIIREDYNLNGQDSLLYQGQMLRIQSLTNSKSGTIMGLESQIKFPITRDINFKSSFNMISGSTSDGNPLRHVSPNFGNTSVSWNHSPFKAMLYANYNMELSNADLTPSEQSKTHIYAMDQNGLPYSPAWWTLNVKAGVTFSKSLKLNVGLENILNKRYRPYSSGISAPGRNLIISLYGRF